MGCGLYCFYIWVRLLVEKRLFKNGLLIPKDKTAEDCLDEEGFITYMKPRLAVLAFVTTIYGILQVLNNSVLETPFMNLWQSLVLLGVVLDVYKRQVCRAAPGDPRLFVSAGCGAARLPPG